MTTASLARLLFGDFPASIESPYSPSEAAARLSQVTIDGALNGHSTVHEVVVSRGSRWLPNPFQPIFKGRIVAAGAACRLEGRIVANGILKLWLGFGLTISTAMVVAALMGLSPSMPLVKSLGASCAFLAVAALLRVAMRPRSTYVHALTMALRTALGGDVPNNSSKPTSLRDAA